MATMPASPKKAGTPQGSARGPQPDPYALRPLPNEDVFFYCKRVENRVVRAVDPRSRSACWSAIGAICVLAVLLGGALAPSVANTLAGYKIQALKQERQRLLDERSVLELEEARLLSPARMRQMALKQQLEAPSPGQVVRLDGKPNGSLASLDVKTEVKGR